MIIVSHDRDFLKGLTDKVYEFKDKQIKEHIGDVYEFLRKANIQSLDQLSVVKKPEPAAVAAPKKEEVSQLERKELEKKQKNLTRTSERLEGEIAVVEKQIADLDEVMLDPVLSREAMKEGDIFERYKTKQAELEEKMKTWEATQAELEALGL
jgi:ATP-binding cassette subfamily F protein 3